METTQGKQYLYLLVEAMEREMEKIKAIEMEMENNKKKLSFSEENKKRIEKKLLDSKEKTRKEINKKRNNTNPNCAIDLTGNDTTTSKTSTKISTKKTSIKISQKKTSIKISQKKTSIKISTKKTSTKTSTKTSIKTLIIEKQKKEQFNNKYKVIVNPNEQYGIFIKDTSNGNIISSPNYENNEDYLYLVKYIQDIQDINEYSQNLSLKFININKIFKYLNDKLIESNLILACLQKDYKKTVVRCDKYCENINDIDDVNNHGRCNNKELCKPCNYVDSIEKLRDLYLKKIEDINFLINKLNYVENKIGEIYEKK
jgi:hypothetical protein